MMTIAYFPGYSALPHSAKYNLLLQRFAKQGYKIKNIQYSAFGTGDLEFAARRSFRQIDPAEDHVFIGHSMGGLLAKEISRQTGYYPAAYISIATPHLGSQAAKFAFSESAKQMRPDSEFLAQLNSFTIPVPSLYIAAQFDLLVTQQSALYSGSVTAPKQVIPYSEHIGVPFLSRTYGEIQGFLYGI